MSLLQRMNANQNTAQRPNTRLGQRNNNQNNNQGNTNANTSNRKRSNNNHLSNVIIPAENTLVRFSMDGMGDPFYRLLGHAMNPDYAHVHTLAEDLQKGGERVDELISVLDTAWEAYNLSGAMLVFNENADVLTALMKPTPMPTPPQSNDNQDDENEDDNSLAWLQDSNYGIERIRAIDLPLTLNVLARARTQVIVARAPAVFGVEYLTRSLITDDPRLVALAKATGALPDA